MNIINCTRNDLGLLYHAPVQIAGTSLVSNIDPALLDQYRNNNAISNYVAELNRYYNSDEYLQKAQMFTMLNTIEHLDLSIYLINNDDIAVGALMQQFIMACPEIARAYDNGMIDGYPNGIPIDSINPYTDRYRYLQTTSGILVEEGDDMYSTEVYTEDEPLTMEQQIDIQETWKYMRNLLRNGLDPSDR